MNAPPIFLPIDRPPLMRRPDLNAKVNGRSSRKKKERRYGDIQCLRRERVRADDDNNGEMMMMMMMMMVMRSFKVSADLVFCYVL
jgi:hypothetical protein